MIIYLKFFRLVFIAFGRCFYSLSAIAIHYSTCSISLYLSTSRVTSFRIHFSIPLRFGILFSCDPPAESVWSALTCLFFIIFYLYVYTHDMLLPFVTVRCNRISFSEIKNELYPNVTETTTTAAAATCTRWSIRAMHMHNFDMENHKWCTFLANFSKTKAKIKICYAILHQNIPSHLKCSTFKWNVKVRYGAFKIGPFFGRTTSNRVGRTHLIEVVLLGFFYFVVGRLVVFFFCGVH